jgi:hypothetical protein
LKRPESFYCLLPLLLIAFVAYCLCCLLPFLLIAFIAYCLLAPFWELLRFQGDSYHIPKSLLQPSSSCPTVEAAGVQSDGTTVEPAGFSLTLAPPWKPQGFSLTLASPWKRPASSRAEKIRKETRL